MLIDQLNMPTFVSLHVDTLSPPQTCLQTNCSFYAVYVCVHTIMVLASFFNFVPFPDKVFLTACDDNNVLKIFTKGKVDHWRVIALIIRTVVPA